MYQGNSIGAVIPAYNEEAHIGAVIDTLPAFIDRAYVVDDCSTDETWQVMTEHAEAVNATKTEAMAADGGFDDVVVPIQHEENRGVGGAIKTGYLHALDDGIDVTTVICGDGQTDPDELERIIDPVVAGEADYAKGNRLSDREGMPPFRQLGNFLLSYITKISSGYWETMDPQNGTTAISHDALDAVGIEEMYEDYGYCNDLLVRLNVHDMRVADVATPAVYEDEESGIEYRTYIPKVSSLLLRDFLWRLNRKYLVRDRHPLPFLYYLGALGAGGGLLAALARLVRTRGEEMGSGPAAFLVGALVLVGAMVLDAKENRGLELQYED